MELKMINTVSDLFKDVHGFRPDSQWSDKFSDMNAITQKSTFDALLVELDSQLKEDAATEKVALMAVETRLSGMCDDYSINLQTALRWDMESCDDDQSTGNSNVTDPQEVGFYLWKNGINSPIQEIRFSKLINEGA